MVLPIRLLIIITFSLRLLVDLEKVVLSFDGSNSREHLAFDGLKKSAAAG